MATRYIKVERIQMLVRGKIRISDKKEDIDDGAMSVDEFKRLVEEAETEVEVDLSERYEVPFQTVDDKGFDKLPIQTQRQLSLLMEHKAVHLVLDCSFGTGSVVDAENYTKNLWRRYDRLVKTHLEKRNKGGETGYARPPMKDLKVAYNNQADNGFIGSVLVTGQDHGGDFPSDRINDPSKNFTYNDGLE